MWASAEMDCPRYRALVQTRWSGPGCVGVQGCYRLVDVHSVAVAGDELALSATVTVFWPETPRWTPRRVRGAQRGVSGVLPCPGLPPPLSVLLNHPHPT